MRVDYFGRELRLGDLVVIPKTSSSSPRPNIGVVTSFSKTRTAGTTLMDHIIVQWNTNGKVDYWCTNSADKNFIKLDPSILDVHDQKTYEDFRKFLKV